MKRLRAWLLRRLGVSRYIELAAQIDTAMASADRDAWLDHKRVTCATVYVGDFSTFRIVFKRERHPDAVDFVRSRKKKRAKTHP